MECTNCRSLNPDNALSCAMCGEVFVRRENPALQHAYRSNDEPLVGPSYGMIAPDTRMLTVTARQATHFVLMTLMLQGGLIAAIVMRDRLTALMVPPGTLETVARWLPVGAIAIYGLLTLAYALGKTSQALGAGFWPAFMMALVPPMMPAAGARIGGRSIMRTYIYLALDALAIVGALRLIERWPVPMFFLLTLLMPLVVYHFSGCALGSIAGALGLSPAAAVIWGCGAPLALVAYGLIDLGLMTAMVDALVEPGVRLDGSALLQVFDPALMLGRMGMVTTAGIWLVIGWVFWFRSVYESLRYPLF